MPHFREKSKLHSFCLLFVLGAACLATAPKLRAQTRTTRARPAHPIATQPATAAPAEEQPRYKAIWEPVNYKQDLELLDVFFASDEVGWVTGEHGTILHTKDGGNTWTPQLGGDLQSTEPGIGDLRFVDGTHGWAHQNSKLLRTTDGENWEDVGKLGGNYGYGQDYIFTSANVGIQIREQPNDIAQTLDSGKTWKEVSPPCAAKMEVEGLTRDVGCSLKSVHFPTPKVGYAIGTGSKALFVLRTEDGGRNWNILVSPDLAEGQSTYFRQEVFFTSENTGFVIMNDRKILTTTDGGQTWQGRVGTAGGKIRFADAEVGWSFEGSKLTYTTNAGKTWSSREFRFPASVKAFSLPSRNRAYVVGLHGMIYRYRVVPIDYQVANMLDAPMMPGYDLRIQPDIQRLKTRIQSLRTRLEQAAQGGTSGTGQNTQSENAASAESENATQGGDSSTGGGFTQDTLVSEGFTQSASESSGSAQSAGTSGGTQGTGDVGNGPAQDTASSGFTQQTDEAAPASNFVQSCCAAQVQGVQASMGLVTQDVSAVSTKFRSLNMILSGMRLFSQLVGKTQAMRSSFVALKGAKDAQSALAALSQFSASLEDMTRTAATGFQSQGGGSAQAQPAFQQ